MIAWNGMEQGDPARGSNCLHHGAVNNELHKGCLLREWEPGHHAFCRVVTP